MDEQSQSSLAGALDLLWARFLPEMNQRVAALEDAAAAFQAGKLRPDEQEEAHGAAHKLAGVLGTFGLTRGTELARELELMYSPARAPDPTLAARMAEIAAQLHAIVAGRKGSPLPGSAN